VINKERPSGIKDIFAGYLQQQWMARSDASVILH